MPAARRGRHAILMRKEASWRATLTRRQTESERRTGHERLGLVQVCHAAVRLPPASSPAWPRPASPRCTAPAPTAPQCSELPRPRPRRRALPRPRLRSAMVRRHLETHPPATAPEHRSRRTTSPTVASAEPIARTAARATGVASLAGEGPGSMVAEA